MTTSFPHNSIPGVNRGVAEAGWRQFARLYLLSGVIVDLGNELEVTADGVSGVQVEVATGRAWVDGFLLRNDEPFTVQLEQADPADDRLDLVVARYEPEGFAEEPTPSGTVELAAITGTPDASPVVPSLTQDPDGIFEVALASVLVEAAAAQVPPGNVTDQREFTTQVRDLSGTTAERNALAGQVLEGTFFFDTDELQTFRWDGSAWQGIVDVQSIEAQLQAFVDDAETELQEFVDNSEVLLQGFVDDAEEARDDAQTAAAAAEDAAIVFAIALGG